MSGLLEEIEVSKSSSSLWKTKGFSPSKPVQKKIADYFGVTVSDLMSVEDKKEKPLVNNDDELTEYLEELKNRPDKRMLFSVTKSATKAQIEAIVKMIEEMHARPLMYYEGVDYFVRLIDFQSMASAGCASSNGDGTFHKLSIL